MDHTVSVAKYLCVALVFCGQIWSLFGDPDVGVRRGGRLHWVGAHLHFARQEVQPSVDPSDIQNDSPYPGGIMDHIDGDQILQGFGGFGGFPKHKSANRDRRLSRFGQFNSDTHGCNDIHTRSCRVHSNCTGCLGLYTCNVNLGKCQLKGLSRRTDGFSRSLRDAW